MSMIEGVGDEVVQVFGVIFLFALGGLAWWSTNARFPRYRTVLVMRHTEIMNPQFGRKY